MKYFCVLTVLLLVTTEISGENLTGDDVEKGQLASIQPVSKYRTGGHTTRIPTSPLAGLIASKVKNKVPQGKNPLKLFDAPESDIPKSDRKQLLKQALASCQLQRLLDGNLISERYLLALNLYLPARDRRNRKSWTMCDIALCGCCTVINVTAGLLVVIAGLIAVAP